MICLHLGLEEWARVLVNIHLRKLYSIFDSVVERYTSLGSIHDHFFIEDILWPLCITAIIDLFEQA